MSKLWRIIKKSFSWLLIPVFLSFAILYVFFFFMRWDREKLRKLIDGFVEWNDRVLMGK